MVAETCWLTERIFGKNPNGYLHIGNKLQLESYAKDGIGTHKS